MLAETQDEEIADHIVADALQNTVAAVDGFGRECCRVNAENIPDPGRARSLSFQNLPRARKNVKNLFGFDFARGVEASEWKHLCKLFEKRHLLAHRMGIVDEKYISATNDAEAVLGRKIQIGPDEVIAQINSLKKKMEDSLWKSCQKSNHEAKSQTRIFPPARYFGAPG